jgi:hypothetical protein
MLPLAPANGINVDGMLLTWQVSHGVEFDTGTWAGTRLDIVLGVTPKKVPLVTLLPWQVPQDVVTPVWLKAELLKLAPFCTGNVRLELLPTWQLSQPREPIGMWVPGGVAMAGVMVGIA